MTSRLLFASYVLDIIVLIGLGLLSYGFEHLTPAYHDFSLLDLTISYPYRGDTVSDVALIIAAVIGPVVVILLVSLILVPLPRSTVSRSMSLRQIIRRKLWELFVAWMGLAMSLITELVLVTGLKNVVGKPRPDMLTRCIPDVANIASYAVGGFGQDISERWVLVSQRICRQADRSILNDEFRSFPSGHSATSFAGLFYLALYLMSKFNAWPSSILPSPLRRLIGQSFSTKTQRNASTNQREARRMEGLALVNYQAAAPPVWLLFVFYVPIGAALYISASRYFDYRHHAIDVLSGSLIGILTSILAYRWYFPGLCDSTGWALAPRSISRSFGVSVGTHGFVDVGAAVPFPAADEGRSSCANHLGPEEWQPGRNEPCTILRGSTIDIGDQDTELGQVSVVARQASAPEYIR